MWKLFEGIEIEGKYKGYRTIFVQDKVPYERITGIVRPYHAQIYFGARFKEYNDTPSDIDLDTIEQCCNHSSAFVTLETLDPPKVLHRSNAQFVIPFKDLDGMLDMCRKLPINIIKTRVQFKYLAAKGLLYIDGRNLTTVEKSDFDLINDRLIEQGDLCTTAP